MDEFGKYVAQLAINNLSITVIIILCIFSGLFKIAKKEIDPLGKFVGWIGKQITKDVRKDVADLKEDTAKKFDEIKKDRNQKIDELMTDYNTKISDLKVDLDAFENRTNGSIDEVKKSSSKNCNLVRKRLDAVEKSNDMQSVRQIRAHVLDFANSCMNGRKHTQKDFDNIFEENKEYMTFCKKYKIKNERYTEDYEFILRAYKKCQDENSFLREAVEEV